MKRKLLLVAFFDPKGLLTIQEALKYFSVYSKHDVTVCNLYPNIYQKKNIDVNDYDGIIFHNTVAYMPETIGIVSQTLGMHLPTYEGIKILFKQDEHIKSHITAGIIGENGFDLVFTCVPEAEQEKVYPKHLIGKATLVRHFTGYLSDHLVEYCARQDYVRNTDVSYRGSIQPLQCGVLGFEKWYIGESVRSALKGKTYRLDISSRWEDRISGIDWLRFLLSSKVTLGVESGSNLFDFDNTVAQRCQQFERKHKKLKTDPLKSYTQAHTQFLKEYEGNVQYAQVSPRHFEAAMTKTLQVLYEGEYSGIFKPYEHYVPLKRDLSNIAEVEEYILNPKLRDDITARAFDDIALQDAYNIKTFIRDFDEAMDGVKKTTSTRSKATKSPTKGNVVLLTSHSLKADSCIQALTENLKKHFHMVTIGADSKQSKHKYISASNETGELIVNINALGLHFDHMRLEAFSEDFYVMEVLLQAYAQKPYQGTFNPSFHSNEAFERHRTYCQHCLKINKLHQDTMEALIMHNGAGPSAIVCCDLPALLPSVILSKRYTIPVIYVSCKDLHQADLAFTPWERDFWKNYEAQLIPYVSVLGSTEQIHQKMADLVGRQFSAIPYEIFCINTPYLQRVVPVQVIGRFGQYLPKRMRPFIKSIYLKFCQSLV